MRCYSVFSFSLASRSDRANTYQGHTCTSQCIKDRSGVLALQVLARNLEIRAGNLRAVVDVPGQALYLYSREHTR